MHYYDALNTVFGRLSNRPRATCPARYAVSYSAMAGFAKRIDANEYETGDSGEFP